MSQAFIPTSLRDAVSGDAKHRCGYCLVSPTITGIPLQIDHIIPEGSGGPTIRENLWLSCPTCNSHKSNRTVFNDPETGELCKLYNPRTDDWKRHFHWTEDGLLIIGITPTGRATVEALNLNREVRVTARRIWVSVGWHPPKD